MDCEKAKPATAATGRASKYSVHIINEHTAPSSTGGAEAQPAFQIILVLRVQLARVFWGIFNAIVAGGPR